MNTLAIAPETRLGLSDSQLERLRQRRHGQRRCVYQGNPQCFVFHD